MTIGPLGQEELVLLRRSMGRRVASVRASLGLSQRAMAKLMHRSASWVREVESGSQFAPAYLLVALARASGRPVGWFYGEVDGVQATADRIFELIKERLE